MEELKARLKNIVESLRFEQRISKTDDSFYQNLMGISYTTYTTWNAKRNPTLQHILNLVSNSPKPINTDYLFYGAGEPFKASQDAIPTKAQIVYTPTPLETAIEQIATNQTKLIELMDKLSV